MKLLRHLSRSFLGRTWLEILVQIALMYILFYRANDIFPDNRALRDYFFKWLNVSAAVLWAHIGRAALFPYLDLVKHIQAGNNSAVIFIGMWYSSWIIGWSLGG